MKMKMKMKSHASESDSQLPEAGQNLTNASSAMQLIHPPHRIVRFVYPS